MTLEAALKKYPNAVTFTFGDSETLCNELLELVRAGKKTATCEDRRKFLQNPSSAPQIGRRDIALRWNGTPALVIETVEIHEIKFENVKEDLALSEGEDDSLSGWQRSHKSYFERNLGFSADMILIFEKFCVIEVFEK